MSSKQSIQSHRHGQQNERYDHKNPKTRRMTGRSSKLSSVTPGSTRSAHVQNHPHRGCHRRSKNHIQDSTKVTHASSTSEPPTLNGWFGSPLKDIESYESSVQSDEQIAAILLHCSGDQELQLQRAYVRWLGRVGFRQMRDAGWVSPQ